jgi:hypothetical protein
MSAGGATPAGSGRSARLDPFALPARFKASDAHADGCERLVEVSRERVVTRRTVRGVPMKIATPIQKFRGVVIRIIPPAGDFDGAVAVMLEHADPGLTVPLVVASEGSEIAVEWQTWARVLGLPALVIDADGGLRDPLGPLGHIAAGDEALPRRRGRTLTPRRSLRRLRRKPALRPVSSEPVYRDEREIIARN